MSGGFTNYRESLASDFLNDRNQKKTPVFFVLFLLNKWKQRENLKSTINMLLFCHWKSSKMEIFVLFLSLFLSVSCLILLCDADVPEVVYSRHPEAAAGSRSPVPAARHGGRVRGS